MMAAGEAPMSRILGEIRQNGYVVRDIEAALRHWTEILGVGPFFYLETAPIEDFRYRGEPSPLQVSIALANSGPLQIELIQPRNDAPSMYRDFLATGSEGLQHVAYWTERMDADLERLERAGFSIGQSGRIGADGRFVYYETAAHPGTVVELSEVGGAKGRFFAHVREAAQTWDGSEPIRRI
jgi:catechol 2,3-dioxygenase-like lactoylglutathione lyase family enzyme